LRSKGYEDFTPVTVRRQEWSDRWKTVEFPLFPRYTFCRFSHDRRVPILSTPGVIRIVGFGSKPCPIPDEEIESLRIAVMSGLPLWNCDYMVFGQKVKVLRGPLAGVEGLYIQSKANARVVLSVQLLQRSVYVEVDREATMPVSIEPGAYNPPQISISRRVS
jgi:transcription antitermination factor NusG